MLGKAHYVIENLLEINFSCLPKPLYNLVMLLLRATCKR